MTSVLGVARKSRFVPSSAGLVCMEITGRRLLWNVRRRLLNWRKRLGVASSY
ncbi:MAG: hypothetical protein HKL80_02490 [Acidimicrobiales bacterium]|nr:hypothetical protein [Acidimicrobiales bacterium]